MLSDTHRMIKILRCHHLDLQWLLLLTLIRKGGEVIYQASHWIWSKNLGFNKSLDPICHFGLSSRWGVAGSMVLQAVSECPQRRYAGIEFFVRFIYFVSSLSELTKYLIELMLWNTSLAALGALAHRLQRRTACQWAPKWPTGSGKVSTPRFLGIQSNFR